MFLGACTWTDIYSCKLPRRIKSLGRFRPLWW